MAVSVENWFNAHGFPYIKTEDNTYYWQTYAATGEITSDNKINWYDLDFFNKKMLEKKLKK